MKNLTEDIKNRTFKGVYLFYGDENYLKLQYKTKLREALLPDGDTMNLSTYEGESASLDEIISQAETMPFFAEHRLIFIEKVTARKSSYDELIDYIGKAPAETVMVFLEDGIDKRSRLYKAVKAKGRAVEFARQDERTITRWVLGILKREKKRIKQETLDFFLASVGDDMENIRSELEKLCTYTLGREEITKKDVEEVCSTLVVNKIFDMIDAVAEKKQKAALELYYDLLTLREAPLKILALLGRQLNRLLAVKELRAAGYSQDEIAKKLDLKSFIVKISVRQSNAFAAEELKESLKMCVAYEEAVKTGKLDPQLSVELLLIRLSQNAEQG